MSTKSKVTQSILVALDVGTTKVCTTIALKSKDKGIEIIGVGTHPSMGLKKGSVVNIDQTVKSIKASLEEAKLMAGVDISHVTIGIAGSHIYCFNSNGVVAVKGKEISEEDVRRAIDAAKAVVIPSEREILHVIPQEFIVDKTAGIKDPVGMCGVRLEVKVHIVTGSTSLIQNLVKCVEHSGLKVDNIVLQPIASSRSVLSEEDKELGVLLLDIGGGTTDLAVWNNGSLIHSEIIPVGGNNFTNDLAVALKIPHNEAEKIKINNGCVLTEKINPHAHITVQGLVGTKPREVALSLVAEVLGARAEELFNIVQKVISDNNLSDLINGGIVLTGGGAQINAMSELCEYVLEKPTKLGYPIPFGGMTNVMQNPKYSTALGLILDADMHGHHESVAQLTSPSKDKEDIMERLSSQIKNVFKELF